MKPKRRNKKKRIKAFAFVQEWGLFPDETLVVVGADTKEEIIRLANKARAGKPFMGNIKDADLPSEPFFIRFENGTKGSILRLPKYEDTWTFWETLIHELHHAVQFTLAKGRGMDEEPEGLAYSQEILFRKIRRKLQGIEKS